MGADTTPANVVEAPPLKPISMTSKLSPAPKEAPKYAVTVKTSSGESIEVGDPNVTRALVALMDVHAVVGGAACHWGGPAAFAEINSAIHGIMFSAKDRSWHDAYNYINDAGHAENGVYALRANLGFDGLEFTDLRKFRSIESKLTGHGESHLNPEGVLLSNGPLSSSIPQAEGLAMADRNAGNDRTTLVVASDGASMEGEAKEAFASIPGLAAKNLLNPFVLILSDNDTKLSGRITKDSFSMQPSFEAMDDLGWNVIKVEDGHDIQGVFTAIEDAIAQAKANPSKPVCLWVKTIKGYGIQSTIDHSAGGHGFPLADGQKMPDWMNEIFGGNVPEEFQAWANELKALAEKAQAEKANAPAASGPKKEKVQAGLARAAIKAAQEGLPVFSISSDLAGSTGMAGFQKSIPGRHIDMGIAESNMVSVGAGYSKVGFIPIVDTFAQFGVTKGNLPLTMAALSQAPVIAVFSHIGFQDAADGASHQATTYLAALSAIPHTNLIMPSCSGEAESLMYQAIKRFNDDRSNGKDGESYIFFVGRENYPQHWIDGADYAWGKAQVVRKGSDVVLVGVGTLFSQAVIAAEKLAEEGVSATVINSPFINSPDIEVIGDAVKASGGKLVTVEDHQVVCGMGAQLSHALSQAGISHSIKSLGMNGGFGQSAYKAAQLYDRHGMSAPSIVAAAKELLG